MVGKRIRRDVHNAHHQRALKAQFKPGGLPEIKMGPKPQVEFETSIVHAVVGDGLGCTDGEPPLPSPDEGERGTQSLGGRGGRPAMMSSS